MNTVAVVGASLAGLSAARALREQGFTGELVVVGEETHRPYDRPPLSKELLAGRVTAADLVLETDDEQLDAHWLLGTRATGLDAATRRLTLSDGRPTSTPTASSSRPAPGARTLPGTETLAGVHTLRTLDDALALRDELVPGRRLVVIGAGFIGAETASTAHALGLDVTVVEAMATPLSGPLGVEMGAVVCGLHTDHGVRLRCGTGVHRLVGSDRVEGVELADGTLLPADLVLVGIGAIPNIGWLQGSGLALGNGVLCDAGGLTSRPGIAAVGDCAAWLDERSGQHQRVEHWTGALERPRVAVAGLLSGGGAHARGRPAVLLVGPVRRPHPVRRHHPARRRGHRADRRPGAAQLPRDVPPRRRAGRRARHEPGPPVHPVAPPARRGRHAGRDPQAGRQLAGLGRLEMTRSPARPAPAPPPLSPKERP